MNPVEALIVDLVAMAESPLYSVYRWLGKHLGHDPSFDHVLHEIQGLIERDVLRLWIVDESYDRTELFAVPSDLKAHYEEARHDDASFDPFGYSLTLGPNAEARSDPSWQIDIDFEEGTFELRARDPAVNLDAALSDLAPYFPDFSLRPIKLAADEEGRRIFGKVTPRAAV